MSKTNHVPYTWEQIEDQVREAILCQLSILGCLGPYDDDGQIGKLYLGIDPDVLLYPDKEQSKEEYEQVLRSIPLARHHLYFLAQTAYNYAYQLDGWEKADESDHYEISCAILQGFPQTDMDGNGSPLNVAYDEPLRRMFETFVARYQLYNSDYRSGSTVRELALLSNMTVPAVRTSLSKEGFKLEAIAYRDAGRRDDDKSATLNDADALLWLSRRRGFVPNRDVQSQDSNQILKEIFARDDLSFDQALLRAMAVLTLDAPTMSLKVGATTDWVEALAKGSAVEVDIAALRAMARTMKLNEAEFVANAVQHLIGLELAQVEETGS